MQVDKNKSWKEKIDPAFDDIIKVYLDYVKRSFICSIDKHKRYLSLDDESLAVIENTVKAQPLFGVSDVMLIRNPFEFPKEISKLIKTWNLVEDTNHQIIFVETRPALFLSKKSKELFNLLTSPDVINKEIHPMIGQPLKKWIASEFEAHDLKIENDAVEKLISISTPRNGFAKKNAIPDSWKLKMEIDKLVAYKHQEKTSIKKGDVDDLANDGDTRMFNGATTLDASLRAETSAYVAAIRGTGNATFDDNDYSEAFLTFKFLLFILLRFQQS